MAVDLSKSWVYDAADEKCLKTVDGHGVCYTGDIGGFTDDDKGRLAAAAPEMARLLLSSISHVSHGGPTRKEVEEVLRKAGVLS
jgi:hypothetical protein